MIIDIHTHIYKENDYKDYFNKADGKVSKVLVMGHYESFREGGREFEEILEFIESKQNLYLVGPVDMEGDLEKQSELLDELFRKEKIRGIKLYPGYQYFYPSDKSVYAFAELCQKYNKPLIFHTGDVYDPAKNAILKYARADHVDELAVKFPGCKMIISHFGFPCFLETANVVSKNDNVYTDISGTLDEADSEDDAKNALEQYVNDLVRIFNYFPDLKKKTMFGTDYGGEDTPLNLISPYVDVVERVFSEKERESVFYKTAESLFFE